MRFVQQISMSDVRTRGSSRASPSFVDPSRHALAPAAQQLDGDEQQDRDKYQEGRRIGLGSVIASRYVSGGSRHVMRHEGSPNNS